MSQDVLRQILIKADSQVEPIFTWDEVKAWPEGELDTFLKLGLLQEISPAKSVICDGCGDGCLEPVEYLDGPHVGQVRAYVVCRSREDIGRIEVIPERVKRWKVCLSELAQKISDALGENLGVQIIATDRIWWVGSLQHGKHHVDVFLMLGAAWNDCESVVLNSGQLRGASKPLLLVPHTEPTRFPITIIKRIIRLTQQLNLNKGAIVLDRRILHAAIGEAYGGRTRRVQPVVPIHTQSGITWRDILIYFVNEETVRIEVGDKIVEHRDFIEMGFRDNRKSIETPDQLWEHLIALAKLSGSKEYRGISYHRDKKTIKNMNEEMGRQAYNSALRDAAMWKDRVGNLRTRLRALFPDIKGNPITYCGWEHLYQTAFHLECDPGMN